MVKLLNTPFGNYGYVFNKEQDSSHFPVSIATNGPRRDFPPIRPSVYDARYLRTTDLSKGSKVMTVSDPRSYVKHGLLHNGQKMITPLEDQMLPIRYLSNKDSRQLGIEEQSKSNTSSKESGRALTKPSTCLRKGVFSTWKERPKGLAQHAGRSTLIRHHKGFAYNYAANRSGLGPLASHLGSGGEYPLKDHDDLTNSEDHETEKEEEENSFSSKKMLVRIDTSGKPLSKLNKLKTRRLHEIYSDMYEKMDQHRRSLIMERVRTAEKIKDSLHHDELEERRNLLKTSAESQQKQLRKIRKRHDKDFRSRVNSLYKSKSSPKSREDQITLDQSNPNASFTEPTELRISLPRDVYGLPEINTEKRPETVPSKLPYRFKPGKLVLQSYDQTRSILPTKFNNVWTQASPISTPRKPAPVSEVS